MDALRCKLIGGLRHDSLPASGRCGVIPCDRRSGGRRGRADLFRARLDQILDLNHPLVKLAHTIDWGFLEERFGAVYSDGPGQPPLPTRLMAGLAILKHMHDLSDEVLERALAYPRGRVHLGQGQGSDKPYEFGVKVSVATPLNRCKGGQFVAHVQALPGNPYDGHTLAMVIPDLERTIGAELERVVTDAGYKGHHAPQERHFRVYVAGQKRGLTVAIKRAFRRRAAVEPVIGHLKTEHRLGRNWTCFSLVESSLAAIRPTFRTEPD